MRKIVVGIQARMGSSRLPGKSLALLGSRPLIEWVIRRVQLSQRIDSVVLLTSIEPVDDSLAEFAADLCPVIRGSLDDVRSRYKILFETTDASDLIRVTGDCPLLDGRLLDALIYKHLITESDYSHILAQQYYPHAYPNGMNAEIFTRSAFERILRLGDDDRHREHVTLAVDEFPTAFHREALVPPPEFDRPSYKLSVDRQEDMDLVKQVIDFLDHERLTATIGDVVSACDQLISVMGRRGHP